MGGFRRWGKRPLRLTPLSPVCRVSTPRLWASRSADGRDIHSPAAFRPKDSLDLPRGRLELLRDSLDLLRDLDLPRDCLDRLRVSSAAFQASPALCRASFRRCSGSAVGGPAALTPLALERRGVSGDSL